MNLEDLSVNNDDRVFIAMANIRNNEKSSISTDETELIGDDITYIDDKHLEGLSFL